jgi:hypothetical protein
MKRAVLLFLVLFLLLDLGDDGFLGKVMVRPLDSAPEISLTSSPDGNSEDVGLTSTLLVALDDRQGCSRQSLQPVLEGQQALKIITCCHTGSSGGIPR